METVTYTSKIALEQCCACGTTFGMEARLKEKLLDNGKEFFCPNGHSQYYTRSKTLKEQLAEKQKEIESLRCRIELCRDKDIMYFCQYRFYNRLRGEGIKTIGHALELGEFGLMEIYGIGTKCIDEINDSLVKYNIALK